MNNLFNLLRASGNPQQYALNQLKQIANSNPMIANMLKNGNAEQIARNVAKEKGVDIDALYQQIKTQFYNSL